MQSEERDKLVRWAVYRHFIETGQGPTPLELSARSGVDPSEVEHALRSLAARRQLVLVPGSLNVWMAHPFSGVPTVYPVQTSSVKYWANCAWDALGIPALLDVDSRTSTTCPDCGDVLEIEVSGSSASSSGECVHFAVEPRRFWEDIGFT